MLVVVVGGDGDGDGDGDGGGGAGAGAGGGGGGGFGACGAHVWGGRTRQSLIKTYYGRHVVRVPEGVVSDKHSGRNKAHIFFIIREWQNCVLVDISVAAEPRALT